MNQDGPAFAAEESLGPACYFLKNSFRSIFEYLAGDGSAFEWSDSWGLRLTGVVHPPDTGFRRAILALCIPLHAVSPRPDACLG